MKKGLFIIVLCGCCALSVMAQIKVDTKRMLLTK